MYPLHSLRNRYGLFICVCLLVLYFTSLRWCLKTREVEEGEYTPAFIHFEGLFERYAGYAHQPQSFEDVLQTSVLEKEEGPKAGEGPRKCPSHRTRERSSFKKDCFKVKTREVEEGEYIPAFIHFEGLCERYAGYAHQPQTVEDVLQISVLDNLLNGPRLDKESIKRYQNEDILFFNRVPKTGSEMMVLLLQWLQGQNGFRHYRLKNKRRRYLTMDEQLEMAAEIGEIVNNSQERLITFDRHVHFTNFTQVGLKMPILINIVRDPVEKVTSRFYYARVTPRTGGFTPRNFKRPTKHPPFLSLEECIITSKRGECTFLDGHEYDLSIPYFCGHKKYCRELNNMAALLAAKRNAEQWYSAIGVLEDLNATLAVFESNLPKFFKGVTRLYFEELHAMHLNKNWQKPNEVPEWILDQIRRNLSMEYEFYDFIKQKLYRDFRKIQEENT